MYVFSADIYIILFFICYASLYAQAPEVYSSADLYLQLKKLDVVGSVLYVAAHPDDENNGFLPYLAKERMYRTGYLSLTRGDGGQNLIGSEQGVELGMIRTEELLAARRIDGAEQYFSSAYEFGFSKNASEALSIWNKEQVLGDMVYVIRKFQPDIIITRFPGDARAGHGHHWASALLANEAFTAPPPTGTVSPSNSNSAFQHGRQNVSSGMVLILAERILQRVLLNWMWEDTIPCSAKARAILAAKQGRCTRARARGGRGEKERSSKTL